MLPQHRLINLAIGVGIILLGILAVIYPTEILYLLPFLSLLLMILGVTFTLQIGGANMPVVISLFNAMTGMAVAFNGFVLNNSALIIAGTVVGASVLC